VDNPSPGEREQILDIYRRQFEVDLAFPYPNLDGYSGAEIRQVAIEAAYNGGDLDAAARFVIPISKSQKAQMDALREWARARTIPASRPAVQEVKNQRRVQI